MAGKYRQLFPRATWLQTQLNGPTKLISDWLLKAWNIIGQVEEWHEIGNSGEPAFENSWDNTGGVYETAAFYKDPFGRVHIKGRIDTGSAGTTAFTLPANYRPAATINVDGITITNAGLIQPGTTPDYLDNVSFRTEQ